MSRSVPGLPVARPSTNTIAYSLLSLLAVNDRTPRADNHLGRRRNTMSYAVLPSTVNFAISSLVTTSPLGEVPPDVPAAPLAQPRIATIAAWQK